MNYKIWTSNLGVKYHLVNMGDKHILNCIKCLEGKSKTKMYHLTPEQKLNFIAEFKTELQRRYVIIKTNNDNNI
jgi:hypothetical protein